MIDNNRIILSNCDWKKETNNTYDAINIKPPHLHPPHFLNILSTILL